MKQYIFPFHNNSPKYKQIYESIRQLIEHQTIQENTQLPSIRQLAESVGVSRNTTLVAYEQLLAEGYIRSEQRSGYFVNRFEPIYLKREHLKAPTIHQRTSPIQIDFRAGAVDQQAFPLKKWRQCANKVLDSAACYTYGEPQGDHLLREQISSYLLQSRGIHATSDAIIIGSSTQQLLLYVSTLLKEEHSSILVENPGYDGARHVFQLQNFSLEAIDVTDDGHCLEQLSTTTTKLFYVTPSHHFPTGTTMTIQQRQQVLKWAMEQNALIIEDDYDSEFRYTQQPFPALASMHQDHVIYISSFSKAFSPAIRLSYMLLPEKLMVAYTRSLLHLEQCASFIHQRTMAHFMEQGYWYSHIRKMRAIYKKKMAALVSASQKHFGKRISIIGTSSGLYVVLQLHTAQSEQHLIEQARKVGVKVYPTSPFFMKQQLSDPMLQLGFSSLTIDEIEKGVELLSHAWKL